MKVGWAYYSWHFDPELHHLGLIGSLAGVAYRKSDRSDVFIGGLHQKVHPEVHQLLLGCRLLHARFIKLLVDQNCLHQGTQIPETNQRKQKVRIQIFIQPNGTPELQDALLASHSPSERHLILQINNLLEDHLQVHYFEHRSRKITETNNTIWLCFQAGTRFSLRH